MAQSRCERRLHPPIDFSRRQHSRRTIALGDVALTHLTLGQVELYRGVVYTMESERRRALEIARTELVAAIDGLRRSGETVFLPVGLLSHAWLRCLEGDTRG